MISRSVRVQLIAFVVAGLLAVSYLGWRYVGAARWFGASGYTVRVDLPDSGGIFTNAEVTYRGVPVGRVGPMRLTAEGIQIDLDITSGRHIPADVQAVVADRSVIGEQYVDLRPNTDSAPYLHNGSTVAQKNTQLPPPISDLLLSSDQLARSVPTGDLRTVVDELYNSTQGAGQDLQTLLDSSSAFFGTANDNFAPTTDLITSSRTVLATQNQESATIEAFSANLQLIGRQLQSSDGDISTVLSNATPALNQVGGLINDLTQNSVRSLLSNLLTTSTVFLAQKDGVRELLVQLPVAINIGGAVTTPQGINVGLVPTFFDPLPCTSGYGATAVRPGLSISGNPALNTAAACTATPGTGVDVRGAQNSPGAGS